MGWKTFKEKYKIEHIVHIVGDNLCIGSSLVPDIVQIDMKSGEFKKTSTFMFRDSLRDVYPQLKDATKEEILDVLSEKDIFSKSLPVFTYVGSQIIEKACEEYGYPNVTHDGELMYDNVHFPSQSRALRKALNNTKSQITFMSEMIDRNEKELLKQKEDLETLKKRNSELSEKQRKIRA